MSIGSSDAHVVLTVNSREDLLGCEIYIDRNKDLFNFLRHRKDAIEKEIGEEAEWVDAAVASRIKIRKQVPGVFEQSGADNYFAWLYEKSVLFQKVFAKHLREFKELAPSPASETV